MLKVGQVTDANRQVAFWRELRVRPKPCPYENGVGRVRWVMGHIGEITAAQEKYDKRDGR